MYLPSNGGVGPLRLFMTKRCAKPLHDDFQGPRGPDASPRQPSPLVHSRAVDVTNP